MGAFFVYIVKSAVCLAVFYLFYRLLLSRETFHRFNRIALLGILILSCAIPFVEVTMKEPMEVSQQLLTWEELLLMADLNRTATVEAAPVSAITWREVLLMVYLLGIVFFFLRNVWSLTRMLRLIKGSTLVRQENGITLITHQKKIAPFSWMKFVVISEKDLKENGEEILTHEYAHIRKRHSIDLLIADICIFFQWFNPASWLLKQELQNIHEFEADESVIAQGIDAKKYQLLLIKKAVGTRLYSMANSFNHSSLKKRITMMLKERTNRWARLKLLFVVPVMGGALYAFAQPEVKEDLGLNTVREVLQSKTGEDQDIFKFVDDEMEAYYNRSPKNAELKYKIRERQTHIVKVDANGQLTLNNKTIAKEDLKEVLKKTMVEHKRLAKEKYNSAEDQVGGVLFSPDTPKEQVKDLLSVMRDAFVEIRADIAQTSGNNSKEYLDKEFPILIGYGDISIKDRKKNPYNNSTTMKITGIHLKLLSAAGKVEKEITNFTLAELERDLKDFCTLQGDKKNEITVSMKVDKGCEMGIVTDVKTVLRNNYLLKLNYQ